jgi:putative FmdB family regulatory protein
MPIYEYRRPDGTTFELLQPIADDALTHDPETGVPVERVLHAPAVHFKGSGFYNTDYGTKKRAREMKDAAEGSSSSKNGDGKSSSESSSTAGDSAKGSADKPASTSSTSSTTSGSSGSSSSTSSD